MFAISEDMSTTANVMRLAAKELLRRTRFLLTQKAFQQVLDI